jgi:hypothetical protein
VWNWQFVVICNLFLHASAHRSEFMTKQESRSSFNTGVIAGAAAIFGGFAALYSLLRSNDIFATDGAHRCLEVFRRQTIFFHENNHMLYPVNVFVWTRMAAVLGIRPNGPFEFYRITELMNCLAAAASLAIIFLLIYMTISSWRLALGAVVVLGFSKAFSLQATNANEAVVGLFWSLLAVLVLALGLRAASLWPIFISGLLFSLSMATYESMVFLAPAALVLIWRTRAGNNSEPLISRRLLAAEGTFIFGCLVAWLGIHGWADWLTGNTRPVAMAEQLFRMQDARSYLGVGPGKMLNLPIGLIRNIFPIFNQFDGLHRVLTGPKIPLIALLLVSAILGAFLIVCTLQPWRSRVNLPEPLKIGLWAGAVGLLFTLIPLLIWDPQYEKLWLQPLALLAYLIAIALKVSASQEWKSFLIFRIVPGLLLVGVLVNFPLLIAARQTDVSAYFQEAQNVSERVSAEDLVVGDWDKVAILYGDTWASKDRIFDFVTQGVYYGRGATDRLRESVTEAERRGGHIYFLGLLDQSETEWNAFIGPRCGVPMSDLEPYRKHSHVIATYRNDSVTVYLRRLDMPLNN